MDLHYPTTDEIVTPEYVLEVFSDHHRQCSLLDGGSGVEISAAMSVEEWRDADNLLELPDELGRALNVQWGIDLPDSAWLQVLESSSSKSLSDLCQFIAQHAKRHRIRPSHLLGASCACGGAFLTIRSMLLDAGADVSDLRPSSLLAPFTRKYSGVFLGPISRLSPGALPVVDFRHPSYTASIRGMEFGFLAVGIGWLAESIWFSGLGLSVMLLAFVTHRLVARFCYPKSVTFGELETFGEFATVISS